MHELPEELPRLWRWADSLLGGFALSMTFFIPLLSIQFADGETRGDRLTTSAVAFVIAMICAAIFQYNFARHWVNGVWIYPRIRLGLLCLVTLAIVAGLALSVSETQTEKDSTKTTQERTNPGEVERNISQSFAERRCLSFRTF